jgi:hypothetical protein
LTTGAAGGVVWFLVGFFPFIFAPFDTFEGAQ